MHGHVCEGFHVLASLKTINNILLKPGFKVPSD